MIDPERVEAISKVPVPRTKKGTQSFFGQINFIRRFVSNFSKLTLPITSVLRKDQVIKWEEAAIQAFEGIKDTLKHAPVLEAPNYKMHFQIFSFASKFNIALVLLQKDENGAKRPIAFFRKALQAAELRYTIMEKQSFALVKATNIFRPYILSSKVVAYVPHTMVKDILSDMEISGKRCRWIKKLQEYDMDIQTTKLVRGLGLAKLMAESNLQNVEVNQLGEERVDILKKSMNSEWYKDVVYYLKHLCCPSHLNKNQKRSLKLASQKYVITDLGLAWKNPEGVLLKCINKDEAPKLIVDFHGGVFGGHFVGRVTTHNILRAGYWWPTLFKDANRLVRRCDSYQRFSGRLRALGSLPLQPVSIESPFKQWGMDLISDISDHSSAGYKWILVVIDYLTKWVDAIPSRKATHQVVMDFLLNHIICRFGVIFKIVSNNVMCFRAKPLMEMCNEYGINLTYSSNYNPQGNGQAESSNKKFLKIIIRTLEINKKKWGEQLKFVVWADRITPKRATGKIPFELVYGTQVLLPLHLQSSTFQFSHQLEDQEHGPFESRINQIIELDEERRASHQRHVRFREKLKKLFDNKVTPRAFSVGDLVLLWDSRHEDKGKHVKFDALWMGHYAIDIRIGENTFFLKDLDRDLLELPVNGSHLKHFLD